MIERITTNLTMRKLILFLLDIRDGSHRASAWASDVNLVGHLGTCKTDGESASVQSPADDRSPEPHQRVLLTLVRACSAPTNVESAPTFAPALRPAGPGLNLTIPGPALTLQGSNKPCLEIPMRQHSSRYCAAIAAALTLAWAGQLEATQALAQNVPEIPMEAVEGFIKLPEGLTAPSSGDSARPGK